MALINIASSLDAAVLMSCNPVAPDVDPEYVYAIVGNRDPGAVGGLGITYGCEDRAWTDWSTNYPQSALSMRPITQAEIDALATADDVYGWQPALARAAEGTGFEAMSIAETRAAAEAAALARREAEAHLRQVDLLRRQADALDEQSRAEIDAAEKAQRAAMDALEEKRQARPLAQAPSPAQREPVPQAEPVTRPVIQQPSPAARARADKSE